MVVQKILRSVLVIPCFVTTVSLLSKTDKNNNNEDEKQQRQQQRRIIILLKIKS